MADDIVTRLRMPYDQEGTTDKLEMEAANEIEKLRKLAHNLYEETKRCGSLHDTPATMDYEEWLEEND